MADINTHTFGTSQAEFQLATAREGNVFTGVSVTAHPCYDAVGTHPTGMLSCSILIFETIEFLQPTHNVLLRHHKLIGDVLLL